MIHLNKINLERVENQFGTWEWFLYNGLISNLDVFPLAMVAIEDRTDS